MNQPILWSETNAVTRHVVEYLTEEFADELNEMTGCLIDIGSGPGDSTIDFILPKIDDKATIVCSDLMEDMVNHGTEKYKNDQRVSFIQLDIENPNLPEGLIEHFDHVTSVYCFHWCQDIRQVFKNVFNLLRPGGTSFITFASRTLAVDAYKILAAMPRYQPYMKDWDRYTLVYQHVKKPRESLKALLKDSGFEVKHCSVRENTWTFQNPKDFLNLMLAVNPFVDRIPANLKKDFEKDLLRETAKQNVIFNVNNENEEQFNVLFMHNVFVLYLKKPLIE